MPAIKETIDCMSAAVEVGKRYDGIFGYIPHGRGALSVLAV